MKTKTIYSRLKNEFSLILNMLQLNDFEQDFSLKSDFSRRHSCPNPPALAGGRLSVKAGNTGLEAVYRKKKLEKNEKYLKRTPMTITMVV